MDIVVFAALGALVVGGVLVGGVLLWRRRPQDAGSAPSDAEDPEALPQVQSPPLPARRPDSGTIGPGEEAEEVEVLVGGTEDQAPVMYGRFVPAVREDHRPTAPDTGWRSLAAESAISAELGKNSLLAARLRGGQIFQLVGPPEALSGDLVPMAAKNAPGHYRGMFTRQGNTEIARHGEYKRLRPARLMSPQLAWSVATFVVGMHWQKELNSSLVRVDEKLGRILDHLDAERRGILSAAEEECGRLEAVVFDSGGILPGKVELTGVRFEISTQYHQQLEWLHRTSEAIRSLAGSGTLTADQALKAIDGLERFTANSGLYLRTLCDKARVHNIEAALLAGEAGDFRRYAGLLDEESARLRADAGVFFELVRTLWERDIRVGRGQAEEVRALLAQTSTMRVLDQTITRRALPEKVATTPFVMHVRQDDAGELQARTHVGSTALARASFSDWVA